LRKGTVYREKEPGYFEPGSSSAYAEERTSRFSLGGWQVIHIPAARRRAGLAPTRESKRIWNVREGAGAAFGPSLGLTLKGVPGGTCDSAAHGGASAAKRRRRESGRCPRRGECREAQEARERPLPTEGRVPRSAGGERAAVVLRNRDCRWAGPFAERERCTLDPVHSSQSGAGTKTLSFLPTGGKSPPPTRATARSKRYMRFPWGSSA